MGFGSDKEGRSAVAGTIAFGAAPVIFAGIVPWLITRWRVPARVPGGLPARTAGAALILAGSAVVIDCFARFALQGRGTPAPIAPTKYLVASGSYRHVRNPMYVALQAMIAGQALLLGRPLLFFYNLASSIPVVVFVRLYEEPALERMFGDEYRRYRQHVPRWLPRLRPWRGPQQQGKDEGQAQRL